MLVSQRPSSNQSQSVSEAGQTESQEGEGFRQEVTGSKGGVWTGSEGRV